MKHKHFFMWYLASPYTHSNPKIQKNRLVKISRLAAKLFKKGIHIFPVMSATASMAKYGKMESTKWKDWESLDLNYLSRCDGILISVLDKEWYTSVGMRAEFECALKHQMPIAIVDNKGNITKDDPYVFLQYWDKLLMKEEEVG